MNPNILVAIDSSNYYQNILHYLQLLLLKQPAIQFKLLSIVPCHMSLAGKEWLDQQELMSVIDASTRKKFNECTNHLHYVKQKFLESGFREEQLETEVRLSKAGIAADLVNEEQKKMYDAVVIGKKDLSVIERMIVGSTSTDVLIKNHGLPVWIINGTVQSPRILVPVDCTAHTLNAVDHLAFILKDNPVAEITLFHSRSLFASEYITPSEQLYDKWGKDWCDKHLQGEKEGHFHFSAAEQILKEAGFPLERVTRLETHEGIEPGQQIVKHVKHDKFGTIVMGRRHKDVGKGIFQGVSDRVLANVSDVAIWILG
ncbi:MAG: universal stress protein [Proteobacteria bacterium]|nr:universal stress protein [Pseudomonadota bacterium]MBU1708515.1 universal stress protein [Pseudomonadota bacterium]